MGFAGAVLGAGGAKAAAAAAEAPRLLMQAHGDLHSTSALVEVFPTTIRHRLPPQCASPSWSLRKKDFDRECGAATALTAQLNPRLAGSCRARPHCPLSFTWIETMSTQFNLDSTPSIQFNLN
jgi:hypothetical protein